MYDGLEVGWVRRPRGHAERTSWGCAHARYVQPVAVDCSCVKLIGETPGRRAVAVFETRICDGCDRDDAARVAALEVDGVDEPLPVPIDLRKIGGVLHSG